MSTKGKTHQRIFMILNYLKENTEKNRPIDIKHLQEYLGDYSTTRQIIYHDFCEMELAGIGIFHDKNKHYYYDGKEFTDGELSLLADVICSSSFLDADSATKLILHIKQMTNMKKYDMLTQHTDIFLRNKALNSECIQNIDILHNAIFEKKQIQFSYAKYNDDGILWYDTFEKKQYTKYILKHIIESSNAWYIEKEYSSNSDKTKASTIRTISPYKLIWDNSQCYLIGGFIDNGLLKLRVYRADKIFNIKITDDYVESLNSQNPFYHHTNNFNAEKFIRSIFEMYSSTNNNLTKVKFCISKKLAGVAYDKFGNNTKMIEYDDNHFSFDADIQVSNKFYGWLTGFQPKDLKILHPKSLRDDYKEYLNSIINNY